MTGINSHRLFTLLQKEMQEYKFSLLWTPLVIASVLSLLMLVSVLVANRITAMGDTFIDVIMSEKMGVSPVITIQIDDDQLPGPPDSPGADYGVEALPEGEGGSTDDWDFSREWRFEPEPRDEPDYQTRKVGSLNPVLNVIHGFMLIVLVLMTAHYLLGCLFNDRKDRSILFWKSMPVSEAEEVLTRFAVALVVAPAIYIALSLLLQMVFVLLAMLLVWRMDMDPFASVLGNISFGDLLLQQLGGWLWAALWVAPVYGWLMLASAWARRSPFLAAVVPVVALVLLEGILLGSNFVSTAVANHIPQYIGGEIALGAYPHGVLTGGGDYLGLGLGLVFTALTAVGAIYLRRYRFEI